MAAVSDKRERLVQSATRLFHEKGMGPTSLADIAGDSRVPLGNVYYYFKTKDDLAAAVIDSRLESLRRLAAGWEGNPDPKERLVSLLNMALSYKNEIAKYGCPVGSLCQEVDKEGGSTARKADGILKWQLRWTREQFKLMGRRDANELGNRFMASLQGAGLLANALSDPKVIEQEVRHLKGWIQRL